MISIKHTPELREKMVPLIPSPVTVSEHSRIHGAVSGLQKRKCAESHVLKAVAASIPVREWCSRYSTTAVCESHFGMLKGAQKASMGVGHAENLNKAVSVKLTLNLGDERVLIRGLRSDSLLVILCRSKVYGENLC